jgi:aminoglycoside 6'-N-acetyltransferase
VALPTLRTERLTLRPLTDEDLEAIFAIVTGPGVREWWGPLADPDYEREGLRNDGAAFAIQLDGRTIGWVGFNEETEPDYKHASLDISVHPDQQARGIGPEALRGVIDWLIAERGHHRFTIDPALANKRAISAYEAVGFQPVGVMRQADKHADGNWQDCLLMDLLAEDLKTGR